MGRRKKTDRVSTIRLTDAGRALMQPSSLGGVQSSLTISLDLHDMQRTLTSPQIQALMNGLACVIAAQCSALDGPRHD